MNSYITKALEYLSTSKKFVQSVTEKVALKAKRSGQSFKEYIHDDENLSHISLVVYDVLPLPLKFAMRYEKFDKSFVKNFSFIREKLFANAVKEDAYAEIKSPAPNLKQVKSKLNTTSPAIKVATNKKPITEKVKKPTVAKKAVIKSSNTQAPVKTPVKKTTTSKVTNSSSVAKKRLVKDIPSKVVAKKSPIKK